MTTPNPHTQAGRLPLEHLLEPLQQALAPYPGAYPLAMIATLLLVAWLADWVTKRVLLRALLKLLSQVNGWLVQRVDPNRVLRGGLVAAAVAGSAVVVTAATGFGGFAGVLIPLFAFLCCFGFVVPTSTALAMAPHGPVAGSASAVLGGLQFAISGLVAPSRKVLGSVLVAKEVPNEMVGCWTSNVIILVLVAA